VKSAKYHCASCAAANEVDPREAVRGVGILAPLSSVHGVVRDPVVVNKTDDITLLIHCNKAGAKGDNIFDVVDIFLV
jgi:hypothetical protein